VTDRPLTILFVVAHLAHRTGLSLYVQDLATELHRRGHRSIVYSSRNGAVAAQLRNSTIPVLDQLDAMAVAPDVIHGNNYFETLLALLHFPSSPAVFTCHGWASPKNQPPPHPRIRRFLPVDQTCRDRLLYEHAVAPELIELQYNFVDMARFAPRPPLPERPGRAFVFANIKLEPEHLQLITEECERRGVTLHVPSESIDKPEIILGNYDLVFARGRCALEAMAVGAALVVYGREGMGPMATTQNFDDLRSLNFGMRALRAPVKREDVVRVLDTYDAADAMAVSHRIRAQASLDDAVTKMLATYTAVIDEHRAAVYDRREEDLAIARFVSLLAKHLPKITTKVKTGQTFKDSEARDTLFQQWPFEQTWLADEAPAKMTRRIEKLEAERAKWSARVDTLSRRLAELRDEQTRRSKEFEEERAKWSAQVYALRDKQTRLRSRIDELKEELKKTRHELAAVKPGVVRRLQSYLRRAVNSRPSES
jgi:predicted  nucleic acid-binding Zn-ribbon protein